MSRLRRTAAALAVALIAVLVAPLSAQAVGYQFWGYYQLVDDEWAFAVEGVGTTVPDDGTVQALRFAVSSGEDVRTPRAVLEFDDVCADVAAEDGSKRVALVIDPGRDVDAPDGEAPLTPGAQCVVGEPGATTLEMVQSAVSDVRTDGANMICGLAGFPSAGCSEEVADPTPEQLAADESIEIPVIPIGTPIVAAPSDEPPPEPTATDEPTEEDTTAPTSEDDSSDEATSEDATSQDATTDEPTDPATEEATEESTQGATETDPAEDQTQAPPSETPDEADTEDDSSDGIPPWAWAVGILVLLGILAFVATSARNRRLEEAQREATSDQHDNQHNDHHWDDPDGGR
ncbi:SCO2322 family protein [Ornithinimicrobium faecis]|uniref:SCO2322 family protein n=1 Tax=Ornithinimicrobium faecis TaxID=2934158 RepID=A0ABY4YXX5_9MICO|nr:MULTISPECIES: SCO2322 family protein [unclassified Ornithinimicrobium]USQ81639.1 SCO2322 family protein [Ornithinimicrobium sp. HY1793]